MDLNKRRILIVDDNEIDSFILERVLDDTLFDCQIQIEEWAEDGLAYLQKVNLPDLPEVIFLDINMPAMSGFDFMRKFAELPDAIRNYCKVVMVTTSNHPDDRERAMRDPLIFGYLLKPVSVEKLNEILKSISPAKTA